MFYKYFHSLVAVQWHVTRVAKQSSWLSYLVQTSPCHFFLKSSWHHIVTSARTGVLDALIHTSQGSHGREIKKMHHFATQDHTFAETTRSPTKAPSWVRSWRWMWACWTSISWTGWVLPFFCHSSWDAGAAVQVSCAWKQKWRTGRCRARSSACRRVHTVYSSPWSTGWTQTPRWCPWRLRAWHTGRTYQERA